MPAGSVPAETVARLLPGARYNLTLHPGMIGANVIIRSGFAKRIVPTFSSANVTRVDTLIRLSDVMRNLIIVGESNRLAHFHRCRLWLERIAFHVHCHCGIVGGRARSLAHGRRKTASGT